MLIQRYIYNLPDVYNENASIQIYISPSEIHHVYAMCIQTIAMNDEVFHIKIENVKRENLEDACMLVLNTLHMYWMPVFVCKDMIDESDFSSILFNTTLDHLQPNDHADRESGWLKGEIVINNNIISFEWERPVLHANDNGNGQDLILFNLNFEESIQFHRLGLGHLEKPPMGFKYPCL